jgi:hypothetical protein
MSKCNSSPRYPFLKFLVFRAERPTQPALALDILIVAEENLVLDNLVVAGESLELQFHAAVLETQAVCTHCSLPRANVVLGACLSRCSTHMCPSAAHIYYRMGSSVSPMHEAMRIHQLGHTRLEWPRSCPA